MNRSLKDTMIDHITGCLVGFSVGDALGRQSEGMTPWQVIRKYNFVDGFFSQNAIQYSEKTKNVILLFEKIIELKIEKKTIPSLSNLVKNDEMNFATKSLFLGIISVLLNLDRTEMSSLIKILKIYKEKQEAVSILLMSALIKECVINHSNLQRPYDLYDSETSILQKMYYVAATAEEKMTSESDSLSERIRLIYSKLVQKESSLIEFGGISGTTGEYFEPFSIAMYAFLNEPDEFKKTYEVASLGGGSTQNTALTGSLIGSYLGYTFIPEKDQVSDSSKIQTLAANLVNSLWIDGQGEESDPTEENEETSA